MIDKEQVKKTLEGILKEIDETLPLMTDCFYRVKHLYTRISLYLQGLEEKKED